MAQIEGATSSSTDNNQSTTTNDKDGNGNGSGVPLLHQYDERWASVDYPPTGSNIAQAGCGPTSFAMVARWYGIDITPVDTCQYSADNGYHESSGTIYAFFPDAAQHWGFEMVQAGSEDDVRSALKNGFPVIGSHGPGLFTRNGHYIVYAKMVGDDGLIVNDPNCQGGGPNDHADDYVWSLNEVLADNSSTGGFIAFIPTTPHDGKKPLFDCQSAAGKDGGGGGGGLRNSPFVQGFKGFKYIPHGSSVTIIKLPAGKTPCEPIYPDYVTVGDSVPQWALDKAVQTQTQDEAVQNGKKIPDGDSGIEAPNGMHYSNADIKQTMDANPGMSQDDAIKQLSQEEKYTKPVKRNEDGTFDYVDGGTGGDSSGGSSDSSSGSSGSSSDQPAAQGTKDGTSMPSAEEFEKPTNEAREKANTARQAVLEKYLAEQKDAVNQFIEEINAALRNATDDNYQQLKSDLEGTLSVLSMIVDQHRIVTSTFNQSQFPCNDVSTVNSRLSSAAHSYMSESDAIGKQLEKDIGLEGNI